MMKALMILFIFSTILSAQIYVASNGKETNTGTFDSPYLSITKAVSEAMSGDTIYVRGGTYNLTSTISINSLKNGNEKSRYYLTGYKKERPLLDFSNQVFGSKGIKLSADYWVFYGIDITGAGDNGMQIDGGSNNIIEFCSFFENRDTGIQIDNGASNNMIINCDSYYNADPTDYGDADGFAVKLDVGSGNYFYGCRAWGNCDDGWDGYLRNTTNITTILENCWTWGNGWLKDGTDPGPKANGNGFKMGGGDSSNIRQLMHHFILKNCLAFNNKNKGFDQNNNMGSMTLYNCSSSGNGEANYRIKRSLNDDQTLTVKNCLNYNGSVELGDFAIQETNSWLMPVGVYEDDFVSTQPIDVSNIRNEDGSLPAINFLNLEQGSNLIDRGVDLGLPFNGIAPDLGAFESDYPNNIGNNIYFSNGHKLQQNYPNPFNSKTVITYELYSTTNVNLEVYNLLGQRMSELVSEIQPAGIYKIELDVQNFPSGIYIYKLTTNTSSHSLRMLLLK